MGDFKAVKVGRKVQKNGGNVASHFLTPDGRVIHSVVGPVKADRLLTEAQWAIDTYSRVAKMPLLRQMQYISMAHHGQESSSQEVRDRRVHQLLAVQPLAPMAHVYDDIFDEILGERVSQAGPNIVLCNRGLQLAEKSGRPLLFILHDHHSNRTGIQDWMRHYWQNPYTSAVRSLLGDYVVIMLPLQEMPALSQLTRQPPYSARSGASPLFVIARSNGEQIESIAGWDSDAYLVKALARGAVEMMKERPKSLRRIRRAVRLVSKFNHHLADELRRLAREEVQRQSADRIGWNMRQNQKGTFIGSARDPAKQRMPIRGCRGNLLAT